ncbi:MULTISPECIES: SDR family oxidoreductase [Cyanophyceae]|uniref:SDR family NAD(P)-dependent oxidoreductase n=1 Tax=Cyanophyceae TaxID=3028117 RepID=UPI0016879A2F|nr:MULTISPECIES: SDR family oxidoreductase [Cyanophyceae]MBD1916761.1 SDR family oxidoreductase [Phormidium sp. FACHB-77]MBD2029391.1 SDR family oxidoreductase [Phormidium sp. FACHB-322]MBD2051966.1 SDR family oxidoreductase [Leptolyngbya sp. FACHB-60]
MAKPILITGASSGIGYALAKVCAARRHDLVLIARREEPLLELKDELQKAYGVQVLTYRGDLTDVNTRYQFYEWTQFKGITPYALVNNAGFGALKAFADADWDNQDAMIQLNIVALTHLTRLYLPAMIAQGQGRILNVASTAAFLPGPYMAVYYATKAYVLSFTDAIATELQGTGVTATTLCPGPTQSEFQTRAEIKDAKLFASKTLPTSAAVAAYAYTAMEKGQRIAVHGTSNKMISLVTRLLPRKNLADVTKGLQKPA